MSKGIENFSHIDASSFKEKLLESVIIDVHTPDEYAAGHIPKAISINLYADDFKDKINGLNRELTYCVYCYSGGRSQQTLFVMKETEFREVHGLEDGICAWDSVDFEVG